MKVQTSPFYLYNLGYMEARDGGRMDEMVAWYRTQRTRIGSANGNGIVCCMCVGKNKPGPVGRSLGYYDGTISKAKHGTSKAGKRIPPISEHYYFFSSSIQCTNINKINNWIQMVVCKSFGDVRF